MSDSFKLNYVQNIFPERKILQELRPPWLRACIFRVHVERISRNS